MSSAQARNTSLDVLHRPLGGKTTLQVSKALLFGKQLLSLLRNFTLNFEFDLTEFLFFATKLLLLESDGLSGKFLGED